MGERLFNGYRLRGDIPDIPRKKMSKKSNYKGLKTGRLIVEVHLGVYRKSGYNVWGCLCDCGARIAVRSRELLKYKTQSCGCMNRELSSKRSGSNRKGVGVSAFNQLLYNYKRSAEKRGYDFLLTNNQFKNLVESPCLYCGSHRETKAPRSKGTNGDYFYTGIDRVNNNLGYTVANSAPCCKQCNIAKGSLSNYDFFKWIKAVSKAQKAGFEFEWKECNNG